MLPPAPADPVITTPISTALTLTSDPSGARVVVDGIGRGTTPVTVQNLPSGVRRVRVIKDGFVSLERDVRIGTGREPATLHVTLDAVHIVAQRAPSPRGLPAAVTCHSRRRVAPSPARPASVIP